MALVEHKFPKTGRIGRFAKKVKKELSKELMMKILRDSDKYASFSPSEKADWWRNAIIRMENEIDTEKTGNIGILWKQMLWGRSQKNCQKEI